MDGIIFDLDGTLWDSTNEVAASWNEVLEDKTSIEKRVTGEELKQVFGKPLEEIMSILFPSEEKEYLIELSELLFRHQHEYLAANKSDTYDGVEGVLVELSKKYPLFIVSNCQAGYIEVFLEATQLGKYIKDHTCPGDTGLLKADNIRIIMERNQLTDVVYVGDTAGDKSACDKAGVPMIHAKYGFGKVEGAYKVIDKFVQLLEVDFGISN